MRELSFFRIARQRGGDNRIVYRENNEIGLRACLRESDARQRGLKTPASVEGHYQATQQLLAAFLSAGDVAPSRFTACGFARLAG